MDGATSRPHIPNRDYWYYAPPPPSPPFVLPSQRDPRDQRHLHRETGVDETTVENPDYKPSQYSGQGNNETNPDPGPGPSTRALTFHEEMENQFRLEIELGEDETTVLDPDFGPSLFDTDFEEDLSSLLPSIMEPEGRLTSDRGGSNLDLARLKKNNSQGLTGPTHRPAEYHDREQATNHGRNLGSGRRHTERQKSSPSQPAAGSKARKWEYVRNYMGRETKFEYEYDQGGRLIADRGFKSSKIDTYLCNHDLYKGSSNIKECGLTLWIQRAPRTADYRGDAAEGLCLYEKCHMSKERYINPGDVRVAFDESPARTPEHDPQTNAGYIHLECLEAHKLHDHHQMFAALNFKVEGREPQPNDSLHRNPTTFGTIQEIVYIEDYLEQCRKDGEASPDGKATGSVPLLSSGIEDQAQGQSKRARDIQRKLLELNGFHNLEGSLHKKYAEVVGPAETVSTSQGRPPVISPKAIDTRRHKKQKQAQRADSRQYDDLFDDDGYQPGGNQEYDEHDDMPVDPYHPVITDEMKRRRVAPPTPPVPDPTREPSRHPQKKQSKQPLPSKASKSKGKDKLKEKRIVPPYVGRGKWKKRMRLDARNQEVWEAYEDPWSPLHSGDDLEPSKRTRVPQKEKEKREAKALAPGARSDGQRKNKRKREGQNDGEGDDNVNEAEGEDEGRDEGVDEGVDEGGDEGGDEYGDEGEDEPGENEVEIVKETQEDHQTNKKRRKRR